MKQSRHISTCRGGIPQNRQARETVYVLMAFWWLFDLEGQGQLPPPPQKKKKKKDTDLNQVILHLWSKFGDPSLKGWWIMVRTSSKWGNCFTFKLNLTLKVMIDFPQNNRNLHQGTLHLWSKFGDPSLNGSRVIARTSKWLINIHTRAHGHTRQTPATAITKGQNWPQVKNWVFSFSQCNFNFPILLWDN